MNVRSIVAWVSLAVVTACASSREPETSGPPVRAVETALGVATSFTWHAPHPGSRSWAASAYDVARGQVVLFAGGTRTTTFRDTWLWNGAAWKQASPPHAPPARRSHAMVYDRTRGRVLLFGGNVGGGSVSDMWSWDGADWTELAPAQRPTPREGFGMAYDELGDRVVVFGGVSSTLTSTTLLADTWLWNGTNWSVASPATSPPSASTGHSMTFDAVRNRTLLFGGGNDGLWAWDGASWSRADSGATSAPSRRSGNVIAFDRGRGVTWLFGGVDSSSAFLSDTWSWNGTAWSRAMPTSSPAARASSSAAFDEARATFMIHGGGDLTQVWSDTSTWNGTAWTAAAATASPSARAEHAMTFDAQRGQVVLFGGTVNGPTADRATWLRAAGAWVRRDVSPPTAQSRHAMAYDPVRQRVVLFGGVSPTAMYTPLAETWTWDGAAWTRMIPATAPAARINAAMAFDAARGNVVLFGGAMVFGPSPPLADTWLWNGSEWSQPRPPLEPSGRTGHSMAYDEQQREVVLFGGYTYAGAAADTWRWNGAWQRATPVLSPPAQDPLTVWDSARKRVTLIDTVRSSAWAWSGVTWLSLHTTDVAPSARTRSAAAFDGVAGEIVLVGGEDTAAARLSDTWLGYSLGGSCATNSDCPQAFCVDGVCCPVSSCGTCETCAGISPGSCSAVLNAPDPDTCAESEGKSCSALGECKSALGAAAPSAADCASGFLTDGVCCNKAECGPCETCDPARKERPEFPGFCSAARAGTDPHDHCADEGVTTCLRNGACDGNGACQTYKHGASCGAGVCNGNRATGQLCSGAGVCDDDPRGIECAPYACLGGGCLARCERKEDCAALHRCEANVCVAERGATCDGDHTIVSPSGDRADCGLYRCAGASCYTSCASNTDCVGDADCTLDGACVPFSEKVPAEASGGCAVASDRSPASPLPASLCIALAAGLLLRARRSRACPAPRPRGEPSSAPRV